MSHEPLPARPSSAPAVPPEQTRSTTRVVYVAMKPQLRGRIRRNVTTLLELGADVTVLTVQTNKDFYVGLEHPRLHAEYFEARSLYVRFSQFNSRRSLARAQRRALGAEARNEAISKEGNALLTLVAVGGLALIATLRLVLLVLKPLALLLAPLIAPVGRLLAAAWRRLPVSVRRTGWVTARRLVRARRSARRWWLRRARPSIVAAISRTWVPVTSAKRRLATLRDQRTGPRAARSRQAAAQRARRRVLRKRAVLRRRRVLRRAAINRRLRVSRATTRYLKDVLRPWHRVSRFFAFWRESAARGCELAPDLVVSSDLPGLVGAGRIARELGIPHVHDCHELYLESTSFRLLEQRLLAPMERHYFRRAESVVAVNHSIALEYGERYGRLPVVVRNCASRMEKGLVARDLRVACGLPPTARVVLYQGGFSIGRGLEVCVAAVADLPPDVHLVLLGYGPLRDELLVQAHALGVEHRVHILDAVPPEELAACTVSATVGLMPYQPVSRNNYLALPNKIFEYAAAGVPIVVSDLPELRRIAVDAGCGAVYDPFDAGSLAAALGRVLEPDHHQRHRAATREFGRVNVWENEREILVEELLRASPRLREGLHAKRPRLELVD